MLLLIFGYPAPSVEPDLISAILTVIALAEPIVVAKVAALDVARATDDRDDDDLAAHRLQMSNAVLREAERSLSLAERIYT